MALSGTSRRKFSWAWLVVHHRALRQEFRAIQTHGMELVFADYSYAALFGWLCLAASLFFALRRPAANAFLPLSVVGMGGVPLIAGFTYARLSLFVGLLTGLVLVLRRKQEGAVRIGALARTPLAWFAWVCLAILAKIFLETVIYGLDASRTVALLSGLQDALFPIVVLLLGVMRAGQEPTERDLLVGMVTFPVLTAAGYVPFALSQGLLLSAWLGTERIALGIADTINSARVLTYGAIGSLLVFSLYGKRSAAITFLAPCVTSGFVLLVLLTGNRQFLFALSGFLLLWAFLLQSSSRTRWLVSIAVLASLAYATASLVVTRDLVLKERISIAELLSEATDNRGVIWTRAFQTMLDHPVLGSGFKNFGEEFDAFDREGQIIGLRDSAHGAFQDVFTEHGMILGIAFLAGCIHLVVRSWRAVQQERRPTAGKALTVGLLALLLPLPFSSVFLNATPLYLLLVMAMMRDSPRRGDRWGPQGIGMPERRQQVREIALIRNARC